MPPHLTFPQFSRHFKLNFYMLNEFSFPELSQEPNRHSKTKNKTKQLEWIISYYPHHISKFNPRLPRRLGFLRLNLSLRFLRFFNSFIVFNIIVSHYLCFGGGLCSHNERRFRQRSDNGAEIPWDWGGWNPRGGSGSTGKEWRRGTAREKRRKP